MGRTYAGILGSLAFSTVVLRGAIAGLSAPSTLLTATISLFAFAGIGWIAGSLAETIVDEAVRSRFQTELAAAEEESKKT
jgi:AAA+ superfamily predicted ATPase